MAVVVMSVLAATIALLLVIASRRLPGDKQAAIEQLNALLPQIQCGRCDYPGCRPYAAAILDGEAQINQCPPGGEATIHAIASLLELPRLAPDISFGCHDPLAVARVNEKDCIGCARCLLECPVDAILGARFFTHTVITDECTGCELCIASCPVDCITMPNDSIPINKANKCIIAAVPGELTEDQPELSCIRCSECLYACPARLLPQELLLACRRKDMEAFETLGLMDCIECGCCDYVCPSAIPLTSMFALARTGVREARAEQQRAMHARQRFEAGEARLAMQTEQRKQELESQSAEGIPASKIDEVMARMTGQAKTDAGQS